MKLTRRQLQTRLNRLSKLNAEAFVLRDEIHQHCMAVYGVDPADIDNDAFIDAVEANGGGGGMTVEEFEHSMIESMEHAGMPIPDGLLS